MATRTTETGEKSLLKVTEGLWELFWGCSRNEIDQCPFRGAQRVGVLHVGLYGHHRDPSCRRSGLGWGSGSQLGHLIDFYQVRTLKLETAESMWSVLGQPEDLVDHTDRGRPVTGSKDADPLLQKGPCRHQVPGSEDRYENAVDIPSGEG